ncbi:hypothetical protein PPERSA_11639 [Pseudocohnilembus persalinus]|uniref:Uncharacterized protein n=1 Tax=Pseudocohnilembus persalinus TaxID=266149 RepID=A0A0V0Q9Z2_PSEPJ|nr:hypothetical protein PPERSA_11639 [Pseudocohnilembus persalinus]|eukprot:KRW99038.1 hypothetical protein PPERSA_11639 [Pseudocohnilembus persalinus]
MNSTTNFQPLPQHVIPTISNTQLYPPMKPNFKEELKIQKERKKEEAKKTNQIQQELKKQSFRKSQGNLLLTLQKQNLMNNLSTQLTQSGNFQQQYNSGYYETETNDQNFSTLGSTQREIQQQRELRQKHPQVTSVNQDGIQKLRNQPSTLQKEQAEVRRQMEEDMVKQKDYFLWSKQYKNKRPQTAMSKGQKIQIGVQFSELGTLNEFEQYDGVKVLQSQNPDQLDNYMDQVKKFKKMVFDKQGNFRYTKYDNLSKSQHVKMNQLQSAGKIQGKTQKISQKLSQMHKQFKPVETIEKINKAAQEKASMHPRKQVIQDIREKSMKTLANLVNLNIKEKIIEGAKQEVQKSEQEMINEVDKLQREIDVLKQESMKAKDTIVKLQNQNEQQNQKNQLLQVRLDSINTQYNELKKSVQNIEQFIPEYELLNEKYDNFSADMILNQIRVMEDHIVNLKEQINDKDEDQKSLEKKFNTTIQDYQKKNANLIQVDLQRQRQSQLEKAGYKEKYLEIEDALRYKNRYLDLCKQIFFVYNKWHQEINCFPVKKKDDGPVVSVDDPILMLQQMERQMQISSNDKLQSYLRKIIVSANQLQRQYLPDNVNNKFDPDKIYELILKLLKQKDSKIKNLTSQIVNLKGIPLDNTQQYIDEF